MSELREKIARDGQAKFGYVDWEVETPDTIKRWYEHADHTIAAFKAHIKAMPSPTPSQLRGLGWGAVWHTDVQRLLRYYQKKLLESLEKE